MSIEGIKYYLSSLNNLFSFFASRGLLNWMPDEQYLKLKFKMIMGYELNLDNPQTYAEKLQWLKLNDRKPIYTTMVDKYLVKDYVANIIGSEYVVPLYAVYDKFDEIDFNSLPERFVIKCTHDSGGYVICKNKSSFNINEARKFINKHLKRNMYWKNREWPYKDVKPRIIIEKYLSNNEKPLIDYKIYTFNGEAKICGIYTDICTGQYKSQFFDENFNKDTYDYLFNTPKVEEQLEKPENYNKMFELAEQLAKDSYTLRVDFYNIDGKIYFGELTFFDEAGFDSSTSYENDKIFGKMLKLPIDKE